MNVPQSQFGSGHCLSHNHLDQKVERVSESVIRSEEQIKSIFKLVNEIKNDVKKLPELINGSIEKHENKYHQNEITGVHNLPNKHVYYDTPSDLRRRDKIKISVPKWIAWLAIFAGTAIASGVSYFFTK